MSLEPRVPAFGTVEARVNVILTIVSLALSTLAVIGRFISRRMRGASYGLDDWLMLAALVRQRRELRDNQLSLLMLFRSVTMAKHQQVSCVKVSLFHPARTVTDSLIVTTLGGVGYHITTLTPTNLLHLGQVSRIPERFDFFGSLDTHSSLQSYNIHTR